MKSTVMIKGTKSGIILVLDDTVDWESLKQDVANKFQETADFLGNSKKAISFQGRELSLEEQKEILEIIRQNCNLQIMCVLEEDEKKEAAFAKAVSDAEEKENIAPKSVNQELNALAGNNSGFFFKGNLRSGQVLDVETSIIILGDVNAGAKVISKGNVIILGALKGNVFAGSAGNEDAFVVALDMMPVQIRIADVIARSPDEKPEKMGKKKKNRIKLEKETKIAFLEDGNIYIQPLEKDVLNDIRLS